ncbi:MAG: hypothetical protein WA957_04670 [Alteraurantiacibacter sp.]
MQLSRYNHFTLARASMSAMWATKSQKSIECSAAGDFGLLSEQQVQQLRR